MPGRMCSLEDVGKWGDQGRGRYLYKWQPLVHTRKPSCGIKIAQKLVPGSTLEMEPNIRDARRKLL